MAKRDQPRKGYGQFCALARALDQIGNRWTLLIVRELLLGPKAFREIRDALPGIAENLLVSRLADLEDDCLVRRNAAKPRSKEVRYDLTERGRALEGAVAALIRWGSVLMWNGPSNDFRNPSWLPLAVGAMVDDPTVKAPRGQIVLDAEGACATIIVSRSGRRAVAGIGAEPDAIIRGGYPAVLAFVASGGRAAGGITMSGDRTLATKMLSQTDVRGALG